MTCILCRQTKRHLDSDKAAPESLSLLGNLRKNTHRPNKLHYMGFLLLKRPTRIMDTYILRSRIPNIMYFCDTWPNTSVQSQPKPWLGSEFRSEWCFRVPRQGISHRTLLAAESVRCSTDVACLRCSGSMPSLTVMTSK